MDHRSFNRIAYTAATVLLSVLLIFMSLASISTAAPRPASPLTGKILVDSEDEATIEELVRLGATRLEDYGAFALWWVPQDRDKSLRSRAGVAAPDDFDVIYLRGGQAIDTDTDAPSVVGALRQTRTKVSQFWLVQFIGPIKGEWLDALRAMGLEIVVYMPHNAYVVWGDDDTLRSLEASVPKSPVIQWTGAYHPAYRLAPTMQEAAMSLAAGEWVDVTVQFYTIPDLGASLDKLRAMGGVVYRPPSGVLDFTNISLQLPAGELVTVAGWDDVFNVEPYIEPTMSDEVQDQILAGNVTTSGPNIVPSSPGYLSWLSTKGFPTTPSSYPVVDVVDDGIDIGNASNVLHPDFHELGSLGNPDRVPYINNCTTDASGNGVGGHGNINAGIVASYNNLTGSPYVDAQGYRIGLGMSPYGRVASTKIFRNAGSWDISQCSGTDQGVVAASYDAGATMTSNSWGASVYGAYNSSSQAYDALTRDASGSTPGNQQMLHIFAAGNKGTVAISDTIDSPGTAKNVLTVGATENVRDEGVSDGCGISDANNADDVIAFSSRGPTDDGRIKPDIMAPGTHVQGPASQDPAYDGSGVCGAPGDRYYPAGQTLYTWSSGTSHSTPAIAGATSLAYEYYGRAMRSGHTPSPAMLKALLLNSTRYLTGVDAGDTLPSPDQGWGDVNLGRLFDGTLSQLLDQGIILDETGQEYEFNGTANDTGTPFRVSLVWTDAPGSTSGAAYVNDLDLEVTAGGNTYKGNVFSGQNSVTGGSYDQKNNVENVFLPSGTGGAFTVRVIARNIAGDGVPGNADATDQDFALVIYNAGLAPLLEAGDITWNDVAGKVDGIVDPGDTVELDIDLYNAGTGAATGVSGVVSVTLGQATMITDTATYPDIAADATETNDTPYTFEVSPDATCGADLGFQQTVTVTNGAGMSRTFEIPIGARPTGPMRNYAYTGPDVTIPDNDPAGVTVTVEITRTGWVEDVDVHFDATHTWDGDLGIDLISPQGTDVSLYYRSGDDGNDFTGTIFDDSAAESITGALPPYTGRFRPRELLSALNEEPIEGTWTLKVVDHAAQDDGKITGFSLDVWAEEAVCHVAPIEGLTATNDSPTMLGNLTGLTATITSGEYVTYDWAFGDDDNLVDAGQFVTHTYPSVGYYTATVIASNPVSTLTATTPVTITDVPIVGLVATNDGPTPLRSTTRLTATITAGSNVNYTWSLGDGDSDVGQTVAHTYPAIGIYTATVTATNSINILTTTTNVSITYPVIIFLPIILKNTSY